MDTVELSAESNLHSVELTLDILVNTNSRVQQQIFKLLLWQNDRKMYKMLPVFNNHLCKSKNIILFCNHWHII